jgi:16S rRNA (guanine966-N2)-methyltransferase
MRVIAGSFRGRKLKSPKGLATRPVLARVREALFNILGDIAGFSVLDLYAGSGAIGIEALSRGAGTLVLVESGYKQCRLIHENLNLFGKEAVVIHSSVLPALKRLRSRGAVFDFIFADPPYEKGLAQQTIAAVFNEKILAPDGIMAVTVRRTEELPHDEPGYELFVNRCYGDTRLALYRLQCRGDV